VVDNVNTNLNNLLQPIKGNKRLYVSPAPIDSPNVSPNQELPANDTHVNQIMELAFGMKQLMESLLKKRYQYFTDVEDLFSIAMVRLLSRIRQGNFRYHTESELAKFLIVTMYRLMLDQVRQQSVQNKVESLDNLVLASDTDRRTVADLTSDPSAEVSYQDIETEELIRSLCPDLQTITRSQVGYLRFYTGLMPREIAQRLDLPVDETYSLIRNERNRYKRELAQANSLQLV
jgi:RNA polymerase sigma factor (sigma-70 family)